MEKEIRNRFNETILAEARQRYGIAADQITLLDGFESFMYEYAQDGGAYILRLGHSRRRSPEMIRGEVDWINYLAAGGAGVARAVLSANGELVEEINGYVSLAQAVTQVTNRIAGANAGVKFKNDGEDHESKQL